MNSHTLSQESICPHCGETMVPIQFQLIVGDVTLYVGRNASVAEADELLKRGNELYESFLATKQCKTLLSSYSMK